MTIVTETATSVPLIRVRVILAIILIFVLWSTTSALRRDVTQGFDEVAHASYVAELQSHRDPVRLEQLRMLDPADFRFTSNSNYLNHAPPYYRLMASLGPELEGRPDALLVHRLINIVLVAVGLLLVLVAGTAHSTTKGEAAVFAVSLVCIPVLAHLAGSINNDNFAFLAGGLMLFGAQRFVATRRPLDFALIGGGVIIAGCAKLTALLLCGGFFVVFLGLAWRRGMVRPQHWVGAAAMLVAASLPSIYLWLIYGSPAPDTAAQYAMIAEASQAVGWAQQARLSFPAYLWEFFRSFLLEWMPMATPQSVLKAYMPIIPATAVAIAAAGIVFAGRRVAARTGADSNIIIVAGGAAIIATLAVHIAFSYQRHLATGWMMDAYPRYYLPLIAIVPLAALTFLREVRSETARRGAAAFLLVSPLAFGLLG
ncbi:MAG: hypothetical protein ACXWU1_03995 [Allosphingosinicella sp.]